MELERDDDAIQRHPAPARHEKNLSPRVGPV
jgi:hypothetical protein